MPRFFPASDMEVAADEAVFNLFLEKLYAQEPEFFNAADRLTDLKLEYEYTILEPPKLDLAPLDNETFCRMVRKRGRLQPGEPIAALLPENDDPMPPNVRIQLPAAEIRFYAAEGARGELIETIALGIQIYAGFVVEDSRLSVASLYVDFDLSQVQRTKEEESFQAWCDSVGPQAECFEGLIEYLLNAVVAPLLVGRIQDLPLPRFETLLGSRLSAALTHVDSGEDRLRLAIDTACAGETLSTAAVTAALDRVQAELATLPSSESAVLERSAVQAAVAPLRPSREALEPVAEEALSADGGGVWACIGEAALNEVFGCLLPRKIPFASDGRFLGLPWKVEGQVTVQSGAIDLKDSGSEVRGSLKVRSKICVKALKKWHCVGINPPRAEFRADVGLATGASGKLARLLVDLDADSIDFDWGGGLPWPINKIADKVLDTIFALILAIVDIFTGEFEMDLFRLDETLPGTDVPADLRFQRLAMAKDRIEAEISVS